MHKTTIARALGYLARYKVEFVLSLAMALVYVVASLYIPLVAGEAIDSLVTGGVDFVMLLSCLMRIFVTALVCFISQYALSRLNNRMAYRISHDMRNDAFDKISRLPFCYLDSHRQGDVVARVISDVDQVSDGLLLGFSQFFSAVLTILMTLYYLFSLDYLIALVVILVSPLSLVVATFIAKKTHRYFRQTAEKRSLCDLHREEDPQVFQADGREALPSDRHHRRVHNRHRRGAVLQSPGLLPEDLR